MNKLRDAINNSKLKCLMNLRKFLILINNIILNVDDITKITSFIAEGMNMSLQFDDGQTPIHTAAEKGNNISQNTHIVCLCS